MRLFSNPFSQYKFVSEPQKRTTHRCRGPEFAWLYRTGTIKQCVICNSKWKLIDGFDIRYWSKVSPSKVSPGD